jgi:hypothetical protein
VSSQPCAECQVALPPQHVAARRVSGEAQAQLVAGGQHRARQRITSERLGTMTRGVARALVPQIVHRHAVHERGGRQAVVPRVRGDPIVTQRGLVIPEAGARFARSQLVRRRLVVLGPVRDQQLVETERLAPVVGRSVRARGAVGVERHRAPRGARELGTGRAHGVRGLRRRPRAAGGEQRRHVEPGLARQRRAVPALVGLGEPLRADQRLGIERVTPQVELIGGSRLVEQAVAAEVLAQCTQHAALVRSWSHPIEMAGERLRAARARERVDQIRLRLAFDVDVDPPAMAGLVHVEHRAERIGRLRQALLVEIGPAHLVEGDRLEARIRSVRGAPVERNGVGEAGLIEAQVTHPQRGLLHVTRFGVAVDQLLEEAIRLGIALVGEQHAGVEQHGVQMSEVPVFRQDLAIEREGRRPIHDRHGHAGRPPCALRLEVGGHPLTEALARVEQQQISETEAHLPAVGRRGMAAEEGLERRDRLAAPADRLGIVELLSAGSGARAVVTDGSRERDVAGVRGVGLGRGGAAQVDAPRVQGGGQPVVDGLTLGIERRDRALHGLARHLRAQRLVGVVERITPGSDLSRARIEGAERLAARGGRDRTLNRGAERVGPTCSRCASRRLEAARSMTCGRQAC